MAKRVYKDVANSSKAAEELLGHPGKMVCGSKSYYSRLHPANVVCFNSNVCTLEDGKIWYGDVDVTFGTEPLLALAKKLNKIIYVLYEMDARFENEDSPKFEKAVFLFRPDGKAEPGARMKEYVQLCRRGKLADKWVLNPEVRR